MSPLAARHATLPLALEPVAGVAVSRVGPAGEGGYLVADGVLAHVEWIVSLGLADDWRFEAALQARTGAPVDVYDHSVNVDFWAIRAFRYSVRRLRPGSSRRRSSINNESGYLRYRRFFSHPSRVHHRVEVGYPYEGKMSLPEILSARPEARLFLKCDIEGWEWRILGEILDARDTIVGMAVEFHDVDLRLAAIPFS